MRENCTSSLSGGRRPAREQSSAPPPTRHLRSPEQSRPQVGGGDGGGKAAGRREGEQRRKSRTQCRTRRVPEAASLRIGGAWAAQAPNSDRVRPSAGARCGKAARRDLCGGTGATRFPTATRVVAFRFPNRWVAATNELVEVAVEDPCSGLVDGVEERANARASKATEQGAGTCPSTNYRHLHPSNSGH